jgi:hypothetical protein
MVILETSGYYSLLKRFEAFDLRFIASFEHCVFGEMICDSRGIERMPIVVKLQLLVKYNRLTNRTEQTFVKYASVPS